MSSPVSLLRFLPLLAALAVLAVARRGQAQTPVRYDVHAALDSERHDVSGYADIEVALAADELGVHLWLYGDRLQHRPSVVDDRTERWIFPEERDVGGFSDLRVCTLAAGGEVDACTNYTDEVGSARASHRIDPEFGGRDLWVDVPSDAVHAGVVTLRVHFSLHLPLRYGRLGRTADGYALEAPFYPLVVDSRGAFAFEVPHRVQLSAPGFDILLGEALIAHDAAETTQVTRYVAGFVSQRLYQVEARIRGATLRYVSQHPIYQEPLANYPTAGRDSLDALGDVLAVRRFALLQQAVTDVLITSGRLGLVAPSQFTVVDVLSRTELSAPAGTHVLLSDRAYQVLPLPQIMEFLSRRLRRVLFQRVVLAQTWQDDVVDRAWSDELRATVMLDYDEMRKHAVVQRAQDMLQVFAFHPSVDQLVYAPQVIFEDVYFSAVDERDIFRDEPDRARFPYVRGRRLLTSLGDALRASEDNPEARDRALRAALATSRASARSVLTRLVPETETRLDEMLEHDARPLNVSLGAIRSERAATGEYIHHVQVRRTQSGRTDPVVVQVRTMDGRVLEQVWRNESDELEFPAQASIDQVLLDPSEHLTQSPLAAGQHPRRDDLLYPGIRPPILQQLSAEYQGGSTVFTGQLDFVLRPRFDIDDSYGIRLLRTAARNGLRLRYTRGFADMVHTNRRIAHAGVGLGFARLDPFGADPNGGWTGELEVSLSIDSRSNYYDWREGYMIFAQSLTSLTGRDTGVVELAERAYVRGLYVIPMGLRNMLQLVGYVGVSLGSGLDADLIVGGGRFGLRSFAIDELLSTALAYAVAEHRVTAVQNLAMNLGYAIWLRELQFAVWAGGGAALDATMRPGLTGLLDVGAGVRVHYEYGGVQLGVIAIDIGYPISRSLGWSSANREALQYYVSFDQYF